MLIEKRFFPFSCKGDMFIEQQKFEKFIPLVIQSNKLQKEKLNAHEDSDPH